MTVTPEQHHSMMAAGAWQCPQCPLGFQRYSVNTDDTQCPNCGYNGGIARAGPDAVELAVRIEDFQKFYPNLPLPIANFTASHVKVRISLCPIPQPNTTI